MVGQTIKLGMKRSDGFPCRDQPHHEVRKRGIANKKLGDLLVGGAIRVRVKQRDTSAKYLSASSSEYTPKLSGGHCKKSEGFGIPVRLSIVVCECFDDLGQPIAATALDFLGDFQMQPGARFR